MNLIEFLSSGDHFAALVGARMEEIRPGYARATLTVAPHHLNAAGICQGGVYFTLADFAFAGVCNSHGTLTVGIGNNITFVNPAKEGDTLTAEATELYNHHKLPLCEIRITNQHGTLLCVVTGTGYRKRETLPLDVNDPST